MVKFLELSEYPNWIKLPSLYLNLIQNNEHVFLPWLLYYKKESFYIRYKGLQERYPARKLFPFARRDDNDDVACWEANKPGKVVIIHDYASPGWEQREIFDSFEDWYKFAIDQKWDEDEQDSL